MTDAAPIFESPIPAEPKPGNRKDHRWGVVLAGGDGSRLRALTRLVAGDDRPKQFCALLGSETLLRQTRRRAERSIRANQILYSLTRPHHPYYRFDLADRTGQRIIQPCNKGTAPAILSAALFVSRIDPEAVLAVLPSDLDYSKENEITTVLNLALASAEALTESVVVIGAVPRGSEGDYGWLVPGERIFARRRIFRVRDFWEKPSAPVAQNLFRNGCMWNTFLMAGRADAFLKVADETAPGLMAVLRSAPATCSEAGVLIPDHAYRAIGYADFCHTAMSPEASHTVMPPEARKLAVLQLADPGWDDLDSPTRVVAAWLRRGLEAPEWALPWLPDARLQATQGGPLSMARG